MKGEINRNFYCSTAGIADCPNKGDCVGCPDYHRKWPTPEQFKEGYGEDYPDNGAVYYRFMNVWQSSDYRYVKALMKRSFSDYEFEIVCACTPWGEPPQDWRPE